MITHEMTTYGMLLSMIKQNMIVLGDETLDYTDNYTNIIQRNFRRKNSFISSLINNMIMFNTIGGNIILFEENDKWEVLDGRSRLLGAYKATNEDLPTDEKILLDVSKFRKNWVEEFKAEKELSKTYFENYPLHIQKRVLSTPVQVVKFSRDFDPSLIRYFFVELNLGSSKISSSEINDAMFKGRMTEHIRSIIRHKFFEKYNTIPISAIVNKKANDFIGHLFCEITTNHIEGKAEYRKFLENNIEISDKELNNYNNQFNNHLNRLDRILGSDILNDGEMKKLGSFLCVSSAIKNIEKEFNAYSFRKEIREALLEFFDNIRILRGMQEDVRAEKLKAGKITSRDLQNFLVWTKTEHGIDSKSNKKKKASMILNDILAYKIDNMNRKGQKKIRNTRARISIN